MEKTYLCIDLKTFYASVECAQRGLNPFQTCLVVANPERGRGAICLAITPKLKELGVRNRCRLYEIPSHISYIIAMPRMKLYMEYSRDIYMIYLRYVAKEDIFVYSIDECFLDITNYLKLYRKSKEELARKIMLDVLKETGITATVGIGTNLFLAKVALDITAKHSADNMGILYEEKFKRTIWYHTPITDIWNIGRGIARRLEKYNAFSLYAVAHMEEDILYKEFGVNAEYLIDHSKGIEPCSIADIHAYQPKNKSLSNQQILFEDYSYDEGYLILKEMVEINALNLVKRGLVASSISLSVGYSRKEEASTGGRIKLNEFTNSYIRLSQYFKVLYERIVSKDKLIRKIGIGFGNIVEEKYKTYDLFTDRAREEKELNLQKAILQIKGKHGRNSVLRGMNMEEKATTRHRNTLIGGHNAE